VGRVEGGDVGSNFTPSESEVIEGLTECLLVASYSCPSDESQALPYSSTCVHMAYVIFS